MILAFVESGSNSCVAFANPSAWLVEPPDVRLSTAVFSVATEVVKEVSTVAESEKLTRAI